MSWTRRRFMQATGTLGALALVGASPTPRQRISLLASSPESFVRGVHEAAAEVVLVDDLRGARGVVLGMVRPSAFVLVNEVLRERRARLLAEGTHAVGDGQSRHRFLTGAEVPGLGAIYAAGLRHDAVVREVAIGAAHQMAQASRTGGWAERLGFELARVASGRFTPSAVIEEVRLGRGAQGRLRDHFVSFVYTL